MAILNLIHFACCLFMTGLIWLVQCVHYPSFAFVSENRFVEFSHFHQKMISCIVVPVMTIELVSGLCLVYISAGSSKWILINTALLVLIWASTLFLSVPLHEKLTLEMDADTIQKLVTTNWPRTVLWTLRSCIWIYILARLKNFSWI